MKVRQDTNCLRWNVSMAPLLAPVWALRCFTRLKKESSTQRKCSKTWRCLMIKFSIPQSTKMNENRSTLGSSKTGCTSSRRSRSMPKRALIVSTGTKIILLRGRSPCPTQLFSNASDLKNFDIPVWMTNWRKGLETNFIRKPRNTLCR